MNGASGSCGTNKRPSVHVSRVLEGGWAKTILREIMAENFFLVKSMTLHMQEASKPQTG